jgi:type IV pilus assembly protein PilB
MGCFLMQTLVKVHKLANAEGEPFMATLVNHDFINQEDLTKTIAQATKVPYVNLNGAKVNPKVLALLPQEIAQRYMAVPLRRNGEEAGCSHA